MIYSVVAFFMDKTIGLTLCKQNPIKTSGIVGHSYVSAKISQVNLLPMVSHGLFNVVML